VPDSFRDRRKGRPLAVPGLFVSLCESEERLGLVQQSDKIGATPDLSLPVRYLFLKILQIVEILVPTASLFIFL
jgi:hypothetical protein